MRSILFRIRQAGCLPLLLGAILVAGCSSGDSDATGAEETAADYVLINARAHTLDPARPRAEAIAVRGNTIVHVGDEASARALVGDDTTLIDLGGRLLLPGFIDTHVHPIAGGAYATALSLDTAGTVDGWVQAIAEYAAAHPDKPVLFGYGFLATTFGPAGPLRQQIDAVVPDRPVLIMDEGFHAAWANSPALERLGIDADTADPVPGYSYYKRDAEGRPTGYLLEGTASMAMERLDVINVDTLTEGSAIVIDIMNSYGVTSAFDAGVLDEAENVLPILRRLEQGGALTLRLVGSYRPESVDAADTAVDMAQQWGRTVRGQRYRYDTLKIPDDGTVEGRTAAMFEDYQGEPGNSGQTVFSQQQMIDMVTGAAAADVDVHVHALGERAVNETLNAIEVARRAHPDSESRYTICHVQVVIDEDVPRFAELDVIAQSTPLWFSYDTYGEQFVSDDQFERYWRLKSIADAGARVTFGSDFPASGAGALGLSPVIQIEIGHTRQNPGEPDAPVQPRESERLSIERLVRGFTIDAAYQLHMEDRIGSLEVGKYADLVVLGKDIFDIDPYTIHETAVELTMMDGEIVYRSQAFAAD